MTAHEQTNCKVTYRYYDDMYSTDISNVMGCYTVQIGSYKRFGATYWSHLQGPGNQRKMPETLWNQLRCPEKSVTRNLRCKTSPKSDDPIYTAAEA